MASKAGHCRCSSCGLKVCVAMAAGEGEVAGPFLLLHIPQHQPMSKTNII